MLVNGCHSPVQFYAHGFRIACRSILAGVLCVAAICPSSSCASSSAQAAGQMSAQVHGLWVWKGPVIAQDARGQQALRDFCTAQGVNEIYISVSSHGVLMPVDSLS